MKQVAESSTSGVLRRMLVAAGVLVVALVVAGCGGDDGEATKASGPVGEGTKKSPSTVTTSSEQLSGDAGEGEQETVSGSSVFGNNCSVCHGFNGQGGNGGPAIAQVSDKDLVLKTVTDGRGAMPAFKDRLSDEEIEAVAAHVVSLEP